MIRTLIVVCVMALLAPAVVRGQTLAQSVPDDAIIYVGWAGTESYGDDYAASHLKALIDASQLRQLQTDFLPKLLQKLGRENEEFAPVAEVINAVSQSMWKNPTAIYFGGADVTNIERPIPRLALLIQAGAQAPQLVQRVNTSIARLDDLPFPVVAAEKDGVFIAVMGQLPEGAGSLAQSEAFTSTMARLAERPVVSAYINVEAALAFVDRLTEANGDDNLKTWRTIRDGLNLAGFRRIGYTGSFTGPDWSDRFFIEAPTPRRGLPALLDTQPLGAEALASIPKDATIAMALRFDLSRLLREVREAMRKIDTQAADKLEEALITASDATDVDIEVDVIDALGDQWTAYAAPSVGGEGVLGSAMINRLDDPARIDNALWQLSQRANEAMAENTGGDVNIAIKQTEVDGLRISYLSVPAFAPSWAVRDGYLYFGLYPQVVAAAANHVQGSAPGLAHNERYQDLRRRLNAPEGAAINFIDTEARVPALYGSFLMQMRVYLGMADMWGVQSPPMFLPPVHVVMQHLSPAGSAHWSDEHGLHIHQIQPFPGAHDLATSDFAWLSASQSTSALLPALGRSREAANRVKCASNIRQIGQGIALYGAENRGKYPADLGEILRTQDLGIEVFTCPSSNVDVPGHLRNAPADQQAAWVNANSSFVYVGAGRNMRDAGNVDAVILYEHDHNHAHEGMNILFGDGRVRFVGMAEAQQLIQKAGQPKN